MMPKLGQRLPYPLSAEKSYCRANMGQYWASLAGCWGLIDTIREGRSLPVALGE